MSSPLESKEFENLYVGDTHDDDGPVIDSLFIETDTPATPQITAIDATPMVEPTAPNQLLTGTYVFSFANVANFAPVQILPADVQRKSLTLSMFSSAAAPTAAVESITVADSNGKTRSTSAFTLRHGKDPYVLTDYTGEVWVYPSATVTADVEVTWMAVTK